ncbi:hypothetical protein WJX72_000674 [[Myrmecia] bisecta]|uniref:Uncharacterized protein n=1 Tax=[Myrmecia] bisecta TaxID=41462 RepID=A0AAW1Q818_9CHLO
MAQRESQTPAGGLLADDQGLGKTLSTISLIVSQQPPPGWRRSGAGSSREGAPQPVSASSSPGYANEPPAKRLKASCPKSGRHAEELCTGGTLVICPTAVLTQWANEIAAKVAVSAGVSVHVYHGKAREGVTAQHLARYSVVLTTYTTMALQSPHRPDSGGTEIFDQDGSMPNGDPSAGMGPERQAGPLFGVKWWRVVLDEAQSIKNSNTLVAHAAWGLEAERRWCLSGTPIQNGMDDLYAYFRFLRYEPYCRWQAFKTMIKEPQQSGNVAKRIQAILQSVMLRRTKASKIEGKPIVNLPPRNQKLVKKRFSASEQGCYDKLLQQSLLEFKALESAGSLQYVNMLWLLLRLRQACNHPTLVRASPAGPPSSPSATSPARLAAARKLAPEVRTALLAALASPGGQCCAQCGDIPEEPRVAACSHIFCRQCISVQVGSSGPPPSPRDTSFACPACNTCLAAEQVYSAAALQVAGGLPAGEAAPAPLLKPDWRASTKIEQLMVMLRAIRSRRKASRERADLAAPVLGGKSKSDSRLAAALGQVARPATACGAGVSAPDKMLVFSQWTGMLDLVELALKEEKFLFRRLDGSMSVSARERAVADFQNKPEINVLLLSLKAAALGLNLVAANHVVLLDLWWNPTVEEQAIDRAHRIGQTRAVHVTRITIEGTVEERILALQERKRKLVASAFGEDAAGNMQQLNRLTADDLKYLFTGH